MLITHFVSGRLIVVSLAEVAERLVLREGQPDVSIWLNYAMLHLDSNCWMKRLNCR